MQTCSPLNSNKACPDCHVWQVCKKDCPCSCFVNFKVRLLREEWLRAGCNSVELISQISWIIEIIRNKTHSLSAKDIFHLQVPLDFSSYCSQWESITSTYSGSNCAHVALQMVVVSESNICLMIQFMVKIVVFYSLLLSRGLSMILLTFKWQ